MVVAAVFIDGAAQRGAPIPAADLCVLFIDAVGCPWISDATKLEIMTAVFRKLKNRNPKAHEIAHVKSFTSNKLGPSFIWAAARVRSSELRNPPSDNFLPPNFTCEMLAMLRISG